jgi:transposase
MNKIHLTDSQWGFIEPLPPPPARTGRPRANERRTNEGITYVLITGCCWQDPPRDYGAPTAVWRQLKRWGKMGVWSAFGEQHRRNSLAGVCDSVTLTRLETSSPLQKSKTYA